MAKAKVVEATIALTPAARATLIGLISQIESKTMNSASSGRRLPTGRNPYRHTHETNIATATAVKDATYFCSRVILPPFPLARLLFPFLLLALPVTELAPPLVLAGYTLGVRLPAVVLIWMLVAMAALLVGWAAIYRRAGRSPLHAIAFPLGAAVLLWIFLSAIARGRRVTWKGRKYTIA